MRSNPSVKRDCGIGVVSPASRFCAAAPYLQRWASQTMARTLTLITAVLLISGSASAEQFNSIISQCWEGNDHPRMSTCVRLRASQASTTLKSIEGEIRDAIAKSKEPAYAKTASAAFEANVQSFQKYRSKQCVFVFVLASIGNGAEDNKKACEVELDVARIEQLRAASWWLKD